jgi:hypothetical protein
VGEHDVAHIGDVVAQRGDLPDGGLCIRQDRRRHRGPFGIQRPAGVPDIAQPEDDRIAQLTRLRDALDHAAGCDHEPLTECPDFKKAVWNARAEP